MQEKFSIQSFKDLLQQFCLQKQYTPNTIKAYEIDIQDFVSYILACDIAFPHVYREHFAEYFLQNYSARAAQRKATNVRQFLLWLHESGYYEIPTEWSLKWEWQYIPTRKPKSIDLNISIIHALIAKNSLVGVCIGIMYETASSLTEILSLTPMDIDDKYIVLQRSGRKRMVPISPYLIESIRDIITAESIEYHAQIFALPAGILSARIRYTIRRALSDNDISILDIQYTAIQHMIKEHGLTYTEKITARKRIESMLHDISMDDWTPEISDERRLYLRNIHKKAYQY